MKQFKIRGSCPMNGNRRLSQEAPVVTWNRKIYMPGDYPSIVDRDMTSSIDVRMAPSNGETLNYTSKERLGAVYVLPKVGNYYKYF